MSNTRFTSDVCWPASLRHDTSAYSAMVERWRRDRPRRVTAMLPERQRPQRLTRAQWAYVQPAMPSLAAYMPYLQRLIEEAHAELVEFELDGIVEQEPNPDSAIALLGEAEQLIVDLVFEADTTLVDAVLEVSEDDERDDEERQAYIEALSDVSHGQFDDAVELYDRGAQTGTLLKLALEGGFLTLPEYTDIDTRPAMTSALVAATMLDAEHEAPRRRLRQVSASERPVQSRMLRLLSACTMERRRLQLEALDPVMAQQSLERETRQRVSAEDDWTLSFQASEYPQMRAAWLQAKAAGDEALMAIIEVLGREAKPVFDEMAARGSLDVARVTIHCR